VDPAHEALRAREIFAEILRTDDFKVRSQDFRENIQAAWTASDRLETVLRAGEPGDWAFSVLRKTCTDCH